MGIGTHTCCLRLVRLNRKPNALCATSRIHILYIDVTVKRELSSVNILRFKQTTMVEHNDCC